MQCLPDALRLPPKRSDTYIWSPLQKVGNKCTCQVALQENILRELEKQGATQNSQRWQHEVIIYCFEYLDHLQDIKTQSLLPVLDYTTMMQACIRMLLKLHGFCITHFEFSANPVARLSLQ